MIGTMGSLESRQIYKLLKELGAEGQSLEATFGHVIAPVVWETPVGTVLAKRIEGRLFIPEAGRLRKWVEANGSVRDAMDLTTPAHHPVMIRNSSPYTDKIIALSGENPDWTALADLSAVLVNRGKYAGQYKLQFSVEGQLVGSISPDRRHIDPLIFEYFEQGNRVVPVRFRIMNHEDLTRRPLEAVIDLDEFQA